ncbi:MAG: GNAT family acetyltransferase [Cyanobacteria bacterium J06560_2]
MLTIRPFHLTDESVVVDLWKRVGLTRPWNDPHKDILRKLTVQSEGFLVGEVEGRIVASVMAGYEGHRGWINYLAVDPDCQKLGYGRALMAHAEHWLLAQGCPKVSLQIRKDNLEAIAFYAHLGFTEDAAVSLGKRLISDE